MTEIVSLIEDAAEGGYTARALGEAIFTEADNLDLLREAVRCHFLDEQTRPKLTLHLIV
jgi:hypothetical protein